jgi:arylsulfatase A-like enzyme
MPEYRGKTTLLATTDHGRGASLDDWNSHGTKVEGAEFIWVAAIGPDTPATGEAGSTEEYSQRDVAATLLEAAGIEHGEYEGAQGRPIRPLLKP